MSLMQTQIDIANALNGGRLGEAINRFMDIKGSASVDVAARLIDVLEAKISTVPGETSKPATEKTVPRHTGSDTGLFRDSLKGALPSVALDTSEFSVAQRATVTRGLMADAQRVIARVRFLQNEGMLAL